MAWGYWSATTVDRGRSPRRNTGNYQNSVQNVPMVQTHHQQQQQQQCSVGNSCPEAAQGGSPQGATACNQSPCQSPCQESPCDGSPCRSPCRSEKFECRSIGCRSQCHSPDFDSSSSQQHQQQIIQCTTYSRRQSLDSPQVS